MTKMTKMIIT